MGFDARYKSPSKDDINTWCGLFGYKGENPVGTFHLLREQMFPPNTDVRYHVPDKTIIVYMAYCEAKDLNPMARAAHVVRHGGACQSRLKTATESRSTPRSLAR